MTRTAARALLGVFAFVLACELVMRALPVSSSTETGYHFDDKVLTYPAHHEWQAATGWDLRNAQEMRSNNFGFVADRDFVFGENAVALIGDSYVEASMLAPRDRPGAQLESALGGQRPVYALGGPGSSLLDYAERVRFASRRFGIRDFVLLVERGDVRQALCGSGNIHGACFHWASLSVKAEKQPEASMAKKILRRSAFAQYMFSQLKVSPARLWRQAFAQTVVNHGATVTERTANDSELHENHEPSPEIDAVTRAFFRRVQPFVEGRLILIVDSDRAALRAGRTTYDADRLRFISLAREAGATVIDTEPVFAQHYAVSSLGLDVGPYDGHLNGIAIGLIARCAASALRSPLKTPVKPTGSSPVSCRSAFAPYPRA